ncbi:hypothetical protein LX99_01453 [Mucilaginibacter oryzae]|uniref:Uncharacterized protein n=1 Tax=Mucilaginibacter oryzae TaxID=468058 RepID=A0A316HCR3_9SPHI|nr:hypothetical protein [Mucilaginibacter oryzae]PWK78999.1 hypothetical protein LX99_01453 [Mucilaginibacter oryzae]
MEMAVIYGAITLHHDYVGSVDFIKSLGNDLMFPPINTSDFGLGDYNNYHHEGVLMYNYTWDNMVISYAQTIGAAVFDEEDFKLFILKMEHVLRNIDFVKAIFHFQSAESLETANLFWEKREHRSYRKPEDLEKHCLVETDEWNFGFGNRSLKGYLDEPADKIWHSFKNHPYPPRFPEQSVRAFFGRMNALIDKYGAAEIPIGNEFESELPGITTRQIVSYLLFKKIITPADTNENSRIFKVIKPELLNIESLYL